MEGLTCPGPFRATPTLFLEGGRREQGPCKALPPLLIESNRGDEKVQIQIYLEKTELEIYRISM